MKINLGLFLACLMVANAVRAAGPFTVNTTSDSHSTGFSSQSAPGSTAVTDSGGHTSLRSALEYASTVGGSTTINLPAGTYNLSLGDLVAGTAANTTIYIHGTGTPSNTIIHQTQTGLMIFNVDYNVQANVIFIMDNVTVTGGSENENDPDGFGGNGGAILAGGDTSAPGNVLSLTNVVFSGNYCSPVSNAGASGGAIDMSGGGNLNIYNCTFSGNAASKNSGTGAGGAIYFDAGFAGGNVSIQNSTFSNNIARNGPAGAQAGAIYLAGGTGNSFTLAGNTFTGNNGGTDGGAIFLSTGNLKANFNRITGNTATNGSGIYMLPGTSPVRSADVRNNWWGANGGPGAAGADTCFPTTSSSPPPANGQITFSPSLQLNTTASPNPILVNGSTTVTASFLLNSSGQSILANQIPALIGLPVTWANAVNGTPSSQQASIQANGTATATFTAGTTPGINAGKLEAKVDNVQNGDANASASITIYQSPAITSANATAFAVGFSGNFPVTVTGFPMPGVTVSGSLPSGVTFSSGSLSGIPGAGTDGSYPLTITATNLAGTNTQNFTLTVSQPAVITSANNATFTAGKSGLFTVMASGFPAPKLTETGSLPGGVTFTNANGILAGTPAPGTGGIYPVTFTATNSTGTNAQSFTLTVNEAPKVTSPGNVVTNAAGGVCLIPAITFAATASGFPAPAISYLYGAIPITSPTTFPLGTNTVTCVATNIVGTNSSSFTVTVLAGAAPQLTVIKSGAKIIVSWPTNFSCYNLQTSSVLASNNWQTYAGAFGTNGGSFFVTNGISTTNAFFRLSH